MARLSQLEKEIPLDELTTAEPVDRASFEHLSWIDKNNGIHEVPYPLTAAVLETSSSRWRPRRPLKVVEATDTAPAKSYYVVRKYKDTFIPSITLSLALEYMHKKMSDIEVVLGQVHPHSRPREVQRGYPAVGAIHALGDAAAGGQGRQHREAGATADAVPRSASPSTLRGPCSSTSWETPPAPIPDEHQTFPVRSYAGYAANPPPPDPARWPATKKLGNVIVMVGPFAKGMAADEKPTPFGLMYGVEMHANALNTILMGNFLTYATPALNTLLLFLVVMLVSLMVSRLSTIWSLVVTLGAIIVYFFAFMLIFEFYNYILTFSAPAFGAFLAFLAVVAYRTVFEERDKRRIRDMFGKYVSPAVVDEILMSPPELGGVDKELTVFFSDIRGFTTLSESLSPQELVNHLNQYLTAMTDLILDYEGTLDKYVGDEIMCFWGAPAARSRPRAAGVQVRREADRGPGQDEQGLAA